MTNYNDAFGTATLPPADSSFAAYTLTADTTFVWPYNSGNPQYAVYKVMEATCSAGVSLILPDATEVSIGEDFLIKNPGANTLIVKNASGVVVANVAAGTASYIYLADNTTTGGTFGTIAFGASTSFVDAASLVGYGIKAIDASLNQAHEIVTVSSNFTVVASHRSKVLVNTGGNITLSLTDAISLAADFFFLFRNNGTGTTTIDPYGAQTIDSQASMTVQPGESLMLFCTGTQWYTVGFGRSTIYQFSQLVKDVSAGGTFTLSTSEAANKLLTFIGNPSTTATVIVPAVVSVYYTYNNISTAQNVVLKTASGTGVTIPQTGRIIAVCDGTNVISAQSVSSNTSVSLIDGSVVSPSLNFSSQTNTGIFKYGVNGLGISVNGTDSLNFTATGTETALPFNFIDLNPTAAAGAAARLKWNDTDGTLDIGMKGGLVTQQVGLEQYFYIQNNSGVTISEGNVVMATGTIGGSGRITGAKASGLGVNNGIYIIGVATENIANGSAGYVTSFGLVRGINTSGSSVGETWVDGDVLYYNPSVAGGLTKTLPTAPNVRATVAMVVNASSGGSGSLFVRVNSGSVFGQTDSNIQFTGTTNNDIIVYNGANSRWENYGPAAARTAIGLGNVDNTSDATKNAAVATLTNKTINLSNNTLTGTLAQFNTACSDSDFVGSTSPTGSAILPTGTTAQRDGSPAAGYFRYNTTNAAFEGYNGSAWAGVGGASGGGGNPFVYENDQTVTVDYAITSGKNGMTAGPITINSGITVTVPSGSVWTIV